MMIKTIFLVFIFQLTASVHALDCVRYDLVNPVVDVKVDFDATTKLYQYTYSLENKAEAIQNIENLLLHKFDREGIQEIQAPDKWHGSTFRQDSFWWTTSAILDPLPAWFDPNKHSLAPLAKSIKPGEKFVGFGFKSPHPPGAVSFYVRGEADLLKIKEGEEDLLYATCEGYGEGIYGVSVMGKTLAPVKQASTVSVEINIKPMSVEPVPFNPKAKGVLPVAILGTSGLKGSDINASTVVFGPKEIKALKHSLEDINKDGHEDLLVHFKSDQAGIRCGPDLAVILKGNLKDGRLIQGMQTIKPVGCNSKEKDKSIEKDQKKKR